MVDNWPALLSDLKIPFIDCRDSAQLTEILLLEGKETDSHVSLFALLDNDET